jgi:hypothetical protein
MDIAIDFDGTCVTHEFPRIGKDIGAVPVLLNLVKSGHRLILNTMRSNRTDGGDTGDPDIQDVTGNFLDEAVSWFEEKGIPLYGINENPTQKEWTSSPKVYAQLYVDDAAFGIPLVFDKKISDRPFVDWKAVEMGLIVAGYIDLF